MIETITYFSGIVIFALICWIYFFISWYNGNTISFSNIISIIPLSLFWPILTLVFIVAKIGHYIEDNDIKLEIKGRKK